MRSENAVVPISGSTRLPTRSQSVRIKRAYEPPGSEDGYRILVDRLWPRGVVKRELALDAWEKQLAPSDELRRWFAHDPLRWSEFEARYEAELHAATASAVLDELAKMAMTRVLTLVYGARDKDHNHAIVLRSELDRRVRAAMRAHSRTKKAL